MLTFRDVRIAYGDGVVAANGASLTVSDGQAVAIIGGNGAGKSTLLRAASGSLRAHGGRLTEGEVSWGGVRIDRWRASRVVRRGISLVPEGRRIFADLTVGENLEVAGLALRDRKERRRMAQEAYGRFPVLAERRAQHAGLLSGGEQQMLAICRGLMSQPRLLILDEPTLGLAPLIVQQIAASISAIHADGTSILLVEQNAAIALATVDYAYVLERGRVVLEGPAEQLRHDDGVRRLYLGAEIGHIDDGVDGTVDPAPTGGLSRWSA